VALSHPDPISSTRPPLDPNPAPAGTLCEPTSPPSPGSRLPEVAIASRGLAGLVLARRAAHRELPPRGFESAGKFRRPCLPPLCSPVPVLFDLPSRRTGGSDRRPRIDPSYCSTRRPNRSKVPKSNADPSCRHPPRGGVLSVRSGRLREPGHGAVVLRLLLPPLPRGLLSRPLIARRPVWGLRSSAGGANPSLIIAAASSLMREMPALLEGPFFAIEVVFPTVPPACLPSSSRCLGPHPVLVRSSLPFPPTASFSGGSPLGARGPVTLDYAVTAYWQPAGRSESRGQPAGPTAAVPRALGSPSTAPQPTPAAAHRPRGPPHVAPWPLVFVAALPFRPHHTTSSFGHLLRGLLHLAAIFR